MAMQKPVDPMSFDGAALQRQMLEAHVRQLKNLDLLVRYLRGPEQVTADLRNLIADLLAGKLGKLGTFSATEPTWQECKKLIPAKDTLAECIRVLADQDPENVKHWGFVLKFAGVDKYPVGKQETKRAAKKLGAFLLGITPKKFQELLDNKAGRNKGWAK